MHEWLVSATEIAIVVVNGIATLFLFIGTVEVFINGLRVMLSSGSNERKREVWLQYSRWLVAGLTIQLAADIIETSIAPSWGEIGKLGAVAVIRTFLNYFLGRDMHEIRERDRKAMERLEKNTATE